MNYLFFDKNIEYPDSELAYSPSIAYPEYPYCQFGIQTTENAVYDAIRKIFLDLGLDKDNAGRREWNPLGEYIQPGQKVLIKPNFVMHKNGSSNPNDMESLVTHPSIVRCIIDYCLIALKGEGSLIIADAPVKDCDFSLLMKNGGYKKIEEFYQVAHVSPLPQFYDLRGLEEEGGQYKQGGKGTLVNIGRESFFYNSGIEVQKLRIPNYDYRKVIQHHKGEKQEYLINSLVLDADVIFSLPKPKTHRKNGYTGALKNFVGVNYSKEYLPHHTEGATSAGGDEYKERTEYRKEQSELRDRIDINRVRINRIERFLATSPMRITKCIVRKYLSSLKREQTKLWGRWFDLGKQDDLLWSERAKSGDDAAREGTWHGNDTLWRTVLDLNLAVEYADERGNIKEDKQRKILYLGDMVVSGEKEGPMAPSPKKECALLFSDNPVAFDSILVKIMGFNYQKFRGLVAALDCERLANFSYRDISLISNVPEYNEFIDRVDFSDNFSAFEPTSGWKGFIEL